MYLLIFFEPIVPSLLNYINQFNFNFAIFNSRDELCQWTWNEGNRFGLDIEIFKSDGGGRNKKARIYLGYEWGGQLRWIKKMRDTEEYKKGSESNKCGCLFSLEGQQIYICMQMIGR